MAKREAEWFQSQMDRCGFTRESFSAATNIGSKTVVQRLCDGKRRVQLSEIDMLAEAFGLSPVGVLIGCGLSKKASALLRAVVANAERA